MGRRRLPADRTQTNWKCNTKCALKLIKKFNGTIALVISRQDVLCGSWLAARVSVCDRCCVRSCYVGWSRTSRNRCPRSMSTSSCVVCQSANDFSTTTSCHRPSLSAFSQYCRFHFSFYLHFLNNCWKASVGMCSTRCLHSRQLLRF